MDKQHLSTNPDILSEEDFDLESEHSSIIDKQHISTNPHILREEGEEPNNIPIQIEGFPDSCDVVKSQKPRRRRMAFTPFTHAQLVFLEQKYRCQKYFSGADRADFADALNLSETQVNTWYQNRRLKSKRQNQLRMEQFRHQAPVVKEPFNVSNLQEPSEQSCCPLNLPNIGYSVQNQARAGATFRARHQAPVEKELLNVSNPREPSEQSCCPLNLPNIGYSVQNQARAAATFRARENINLEGLLQKMALFTPSET